jgi:hypothetical protein
MSTPRAATILRADIVSGNFVAARGLVDRELGRDAVVLPGSTMTACRVHNRRFE